MKRMSLCEFDVCHPAVLSVLKNSTCTQSDTTLIVNKTCCTKSGAFCFDFIIYNQANTIKYTNVTDT